MMLNNKMTPKLTEAKLAVITVGLESFAIEAEKQETPVISVSWKPNSENDPQLAWELAEMGA